MFTEEPMARIKVTVNAVFSPNLATQHHAPELLARHSTTTSRSDHVPLSVPLSPNLTVTQSKLEHAEQIVLAQYDRLRGDDGIPSFAESYQFAEP